MFSKNWNRNRIRIRIESSIPFSHEPTESITSFCDLTYNPSHCGARKSFRALKLTMGVYVRNHNPRRLRKLGLKGPSRSRWFKEGLETPWAFKEDSHSQ